MPISCLFLWNDHKSYKSRLKNKERLIFRSDTQLALKTTTARTSSSYHHHHHHHHHHHQQQQQQQQQQQ